MNKRVFSGATCTKPTVSNGSIQPDSATIADGAEYTVTCSNAFTMSGDAQVTCTNGVLSAAPTCLKGVLISITAFICKQVSGIPLNLLNCLNFIYS